MRIRDLTKEKSVFIVPFVLLMVLVLSVASSVTAQAADKWPTEAVRLIVPFSAGGLVDTFARGLQPHLKKELGDIA